MASVQKQPMHGRMSPNAAKRGDFLVSSRRLASGNRVMPKVPSLPQLNNNSFSFKKTFVNNTPTNFNQMIINPPTPKNASKTTASSSSTSSNGNAASTVKTPFNLLPNEKVKPLRIGTKPPVSRDTPPKNESLTERQHMKLDGMWDQYKGCWFDIQCKNLVPFFVEIPSPKRLNSLSKIDDSKASKDTGTTQTKGFRIYKCNYKKFRDLENEVIETCTGCNTKKKRGVRIGCNHFVCRECIQSHIRKHVEKEKVPIKCMKQGCKYELDKTEVNKYAATTEIVKRYANLCVTKFVEKNPHMLVQCFTPGCGYVVDLSKLKQKDVLHCSRCKTSYCMTCHKQPHSGVPCGDI